MEKRSDISITVEEVPGGCSNNLFVSGDCNENVMSGDDVATSWKCGNCTGDPSGEGFPKKSSLTVAEKPTSLGLDKPTYSPAPSPQETWNISGPMILRSDIREASQSPWLQKEIQKVLSSGGNYLQIPTAGSTRRRHSWICGSELFKTTR
ncbi:uncharacterized protein LOC111699218 [Eurytemora carolleeae]|uniref:uncharacterized protein LOC111699218 n=1 Tax=Eurytemora carolleeae TaxID=1294199 RepID=UPI000C789461|nr:uncharacterized protein LOC111699218 [Eurytemora carolleeae]|eukprot:XP_023325597.1 uncharacterized protein LOC111699218 [Eurytemora affinis]